MKSIIIEESDYSPKVVFDKDNNEFCIIGKSLLEDSAKFYKPLQSWINEYVNNPNSKTEFIFELEYFNSSAARRIVNLIIKLEDILNKGENDVIVIWRHKENDEVMIDRGEEIKSIVRLPFDFVQID